MQKEIIKLINNEMCRIRSRNPSYSLRAFSNHINIQASALSEIMSGKRLITKKMGRKILQGLRLPPQQIDSIVAQKSYSDDSSNLSLEHFKVISDWYYFAILSLAEIDNFKACPKWISNRLNIPQKSAKIALERLIKLEMLEQDDDGSYKATGVQFKTPTEIANISIKNHTIQSLDLAKESLINDPVELRDFSTITMAIDPSQLEEAKKMIQLFRKRLSKKLESGSKTEVYKLAIQLFPLSKKDKTTREKHNA